MGDLDEQGDSFQICETTLVVERSYVSYPHSSSYALHMTYSAPLVPHLPYHTYSHINYHGNSSYSSGQIPFN